MAKIKTIKLTDGWNPSRPLSTFAPGDLAGYQEALRFRVEQVTDSIEFKIGELLERDQVTVLCGDPEWKVTITQKSRE
jgi:hypothetical protein